MTDVAKRIRNAISSNRAMGLKGTSWDNQAVAYVTAQDEALGLDSAAEYYDLDEQTRQRILVNLRQDTAHALLNTSSLINELKYIKRLIWLLIAVALYSGVMVTGVIILQSDAIHHPR